MIGKVYSIPPQPPVAEHTREFAAGAVTFGVEFRDVDPETLRATYAGNEEHLAELEERSPEGGFFDAGVSIHVCGADDGYEYVRFDCFDDEPHYHYIHRTPDGSVVNQVIDFDAVAGGDMLSWTIERLRTRLAEMLTAAGGAVVAGRLEQTRIDDTLEQVQAAAEHARRDPSVRRSG
jgi:hypothetical protein